jgi:hypothetical protein
MRAFPSVLARSSYCAAKAADERAVCCGGGLEFVSRRDVAGKDEDRVNNHDAVNLFIPCDLERSPTRIFSVVPGTFAQPFANRD